MVNIIENLEQSYCVIQIGEEVTEQDTQNYLARFTNLINHQERIGFAFQYLGGKPRKSKVAEKMESQWLRVHKKELEKYCLGIAMVTSPSIESLLKRIILKGAGKRLFGCDCELFYSMDKAEEWFRTRSQSKS
ncbi:MAG: hypothetical protein V7K38_14980 [Nostoc sp.]|uniref:hypothetical protein n=1 Tax=Nostoc sp. TaxID=1180 RepID=UPI002FF9F6BD